MIANCPLGSLSTDCAFSRWKSVEVAVKKALLLIGAGLLMAACSESTTAPAARKTTGARAHADDITCRSGYTVAYDKDGNPYCAPDDGGSP
jgi:hypothetical protein